MVQRTRMFKTVACLAAAMICFTSVLSWMEPRAAADAVPDDPMVMERLAESVVLLPAETRVAAWNGIDVRLVAGSTVSDKEPCHFVISTFGLIRRTIDWAEQWPADDHQSAVVVAMTRVGGDDRISAFQWAGLRALTTALVDRVPTLTRECTMRAFTPESTERVGPFMSIGELIGYPAAATSQRVETRANEPNPRHVAQPTT
ncbi:MAG: hypothetical protein HOP29_17360 [Phycisphaerales bacterium]|nr:hypothetical protein [Phycisphaerales bacterium]